jgi:tellurite resistance protein TerC
MELNLFPLSEYWWIYAAFTGFVLAMLAVDLGIFHRKSHSVSFREAATWSAVWVVLALSFSYLLYQYSLWKFPQDARLMAFPGFDPQAAARMVSLEFLTGYILEKSLSVDNIFVFVLIFGYFRIPAKYQHRVLFYGIVGALIFRAIFIALGAVLMQYHWVIFLFGAFLILTGVKMMYSPEKEIEPEKNLLIRAFKRFVPVTHELHGDRFFIRESTRVYATPLLVTLLLVEMTDIVFAVDSVPAIFAVTNEPMLVFTSNIFAILGLRAMYFMLAGAIDKFYLLKYGLALVLIFVGLKMAWLNDLYNGKFPITLSLGIIAAVIASSIILSLLFPKKPAPAEAESSHSAGARKHLRLVGDKHAEPEQVKTEPVGAEQVGAEQVKAEQAAASKGKKVI